MIIKKILIANRGEIAVRIMRTAQSLGYETVAVFSDADAAAPHVEMADQAVRLGPADVGESYLHMERVLDAAVKTGADAIHPGYGFLSENPDFAALVIKSGMTWIGPTPESMRVMGNKAAAKEAIANTAVRTIPGYAGADQSDATFIKTAAKIGFPVMVKAAAGGGGRGMRLVASADELPAALASARSEAAKAFGSGELLLEKAIVNPRHIEVQVFGDQHGNVIHLGERDCSIQRRNQKVFEEAPAPSISRAVREAVGYQARVVAKEIDYVGAGTVEFLLDEDDNLFFIEMNTRLQVEHPVTELVTGQDLVAWQIAIAAGEPLPLNQDEVRIHGHAIEVRLYAEDPDNRFLPSTGPIYAWEPAAGEGIRVDHGLKSGMAITPFYDAMVAKIIAYGDTREIARRRLGRALRQTAVLGVTTNRHFLLATNAHPIFAAGEATTSFVADQWQPADRPTSGRLKAVAAVLFNRQHSTPANRLLSGWGHRPFTCCFGDGTLSVTTEAADRYQVQVGAERFQIRCLAQAQNRLRFEQDGVQTTAWFAFGPDGDLWLQIGAETARLCNSLLAPPDSGDGIGSGRIVAPLPGAVMRIDVAVGDSVTKGETLLILEAMKMEHTISAPFDGTVEEILIKTGQQMKPKELMIVVS